MAHKRHGRKCYEREHKHMDEYSRILIEECCWNNDTAKSRRLQKLIDKSHDIYAEYSESDSLFIEKLIAAEKNEEFKEALQDLNSWMFPW